MGCSDWDLRKIDPLPGRTGYVWVDDDESSRAGKGMAPSRMCDAIRSDGDSFRCAMVKGQVMMYPAIPATRCRLESRRAS